MHLLKKQDSNSSNITLKDKIRMFLLVLFSANQYFRENAVVMTIVGLVFLFLLDYNIYSHFFSINNIYAYLIILFFLSFEIIHRYIFHIDNTLTIFKLLGYFLFSFFVVKALKNKFIKTYIIVIYYLAIISLVLYAVLSFFPYFYFLYNIAEQYFPLKYSIDPTLLIYTFDKSAYVNQALLIRNAGFAWEAGGFATYLTLALVFQIGTNKITIGKIIKDKTSLVLIIAIVSTFSTAGFLAMFVALILPMYSMQVSIFLKILISFVFITIFYIFIINVDFLGAKIEGQFKNANKSQNRIGSAYLDWKNIKERPLTGWSRKENVLFGDKAFTYKTHRPNGLTNYLRCYGFIYVSFLVIIWFISFYSYFKYIGTMYPVVATSFIIIIILTMAFSQLIFDDFMFRSFLFLFCVYNSSFKKRYIIKRPKCRNTIVH